MATITVQNVIDAVAKDISNMFFSSGGNSSLLIDYTNRIHLDLLRYSNFSFSTSLPKRFITQEMQTDYWIGATAGQSSGQTDTGLNLTDVYRIKDNTVIDRSNYKTLGAVEEPFPYTNWAYQDGTFRPGRPAQYQYNIEEPSILRIYPAPDNQNLYQPVPAAPTCITSTSGALAARTYYVRCTFVDSAGGESSGSNANTRVVVPVNKVLVVQSPDAPFTGTATGVSYSSYNVYVSTTSGSETLQSTATTLGTNWTEPGSGLVAGAAWPTASTLEPMYGYLIEFRYLKARTALTSVSDTLQIPSDYKDVVVAGVNALALLWLEDQRSNIWEGQYNGLRATMLRDKNRNAATSNFMKPDSAATRRSEGY